MGDHLRDPVSQAWEDILGAGDDSHRPPPRTHLDRISKL